MASCRARRGVAVVAAAPHHVAGEVRLVTVKVLLSAEPQTPIAHGKKGRDELVCRFTESGALCDVALGW